jgi:phosphoglycolate phosphatase-like HAD superfamily hydrolase
MKNEFLEKFSTIFWDFDGVIKDSVNVKTQAYFNLFKPFGFDVAERVRKHHEANGGISRYDKFPIYLQWAGIEPNQNIINDYCYKFSQRVMLEVINSPWVNGAEQYLRNNKHKQLFFLVSATPYDELEVILERLDLKKCFNKVYGSPTSKYDAIQDALFSYRLNYENCLSIGDSQADIDAAVSHKINFLLRCHDSNAKLFENYDGFFVKDFKEHESPKKN